LGFGTESSSLDDTAGTKRSLTSREFGIFGGYRFLPLGYFYGPRFDVKLGYLSESFSTDPLSSEEYGGGSFKGLSLGGSAHVPLNREIDLEATILFAPKAGYDAKSGATAGDGANMLLFNFLGTYRINTQYSLFAGLRAATFKADVGSKGEVQYSQVMLNGGMEFAF